MQVLNLYQMAESFGTRPSDLIGLRNTWVRWMFDRAVFIFGAHVMSEYHKRRKDGVTLEEIMGLPIPQKPINVARLLAMPGTG